MPKARKRKELWLRQRVNMGAGGKQAVRAVDRWKMDREAAKKVTEAILLYADLLEGRMEKFLELFPQFGGLASGSVPPVSRPAYTARTGAPEPVIVQTVLDEETVLVNMLDGFGFNMGDD